MKRLSILLFFISLMMPPCHEPGTSMAQECSENQVARLTLPMVGGSVPAGAPAGGIKFVQAKANYTSGTAPSVQVTFDTATTPGNAVIVLTVTYFAESAINGQVTGTGTYTLDIGSAGQNRGLHSQLNIAGDVGTITYTPANTSYLAIIAAEFSGVASSSAFEAGCGTLEYSTSNTSFSISTTSDSTAADLIIGGGKDGTADRSHTASSPTLLAADVDADGYQGGVLVYKIQSTAGAETLNWTSSAAEVFSKILGCYKPAP